MILYKCRNDSDFTDKILIDKKVWLSNAAGLNDPFECTIGEIAKDWIEAEVKKLKDGHMHGFLNTAMQSINTNTDFFGLRTKQTKEFLSKLNKRIIMHNTKLLEIFFLERQKKSLAFLKKHLRTLTNNLTM